jgi:hypothetical protein
MIALLLDFIFVSADISPCSFGWWWLMAGADLF